LPSASDFQHHSTEYAGRAPGLHQYSPPGSTNFREEDYRTGEQRPIKSTPFFLTYGIDARTPSLPDPDLNRYYGQSDVAAWYATLQQCRQIAAQNNIQASNYMQSQFKKKLCRLITHLVN
jgi:hypothetical protein